MKKINYSDLTSDYLCSAFSELENNIKSVADVDLPHCLFGDFFNPLLTKVLKSPDYSENLLVIKIFDFYEQLAEYGDDEVKNLLQVTLLEYLWDDYIVYTRAVEMMGKHTQSVNKEIEKYLCSPSKTQ